MNSQLSFQFRLWTVAGAALYSNRAQAILWETQADRLQLVSVSLLDGLPATRPFPSNTLGLGISADFSMLPKPNTTVGNKHDKKPFTPIHAIPTAEALIHKEFQDSNVGLRIYGGFLPPLPKAISQLDAKLSENSYGAVAHYGFGVSATMQVFLQTGIHFSNGALTGKLSSADSTKDKLSFKTKNEFLSAGLQHSPSGVYAAYLTGLRQSSSTYFIDEDSTSLNLSDKLSDARIPLYSQFTVGWVPKPSLTVGFSFIYIPNRLYMPKLSLSYLIFNLNAETAAYGAKGMSDPEHFPSNPSKALPAVPNATPIPSSAKEVEPVKTPPPEIKVKTKSGSPSQGAAGSTKGAGPAKATGGKQK